MSWLAGDMTDKVLELLSRAKSTSDPPKKLAGLCKRPRESGESLKEAGPTELESQGILDLEKEARNEMSQQIAFLERLAKGQPSHTSEVRYWSFQCKDLSWKVSSATRIEGRFDD